VLITEVFSSESHCIWLLHRMSRESNCMRYKTSLKCFFQNRTVYDYYIVCRASQIACDTRHIVTSFVPLTAGFGVLFLCSGLAHAHLTSAYRKSLWNNNNRSIIINIEHIKQISRGGGVRLMHSCAVVATEYFAVNVIVSNRRVYVNISITSVVLVVSLPSVIVQELL
jgi:hypothetical protein